MMYPFYRSKRGGSLYPTLFQKIYVKEEYTHRGAKRVDVDRVYVQGLRWDVKHEEILPTCQFLKNVKFCFILTDDLDRTLRREWPEYRD